MLIGEKNFDESANKRDVALRNCGEHRVELEQIDFSCGNADMGVQGVEGKTNQIAEDYPWKILVKELQKYKMLWSNMSRSGTKG